MIEILSSVEFKRIGENSYAMLSDSYAVNGDPVCCDGKIKSFDSNKYKEKYPEGKGCNKVIEIFRKF